MNKPEELETSKKKRSYPFDDLFSAIDEDADNITKSERIAKEAEQFNIKPSVLEELDKIPKPDKVKRHEKRVKLLEKVY